MNPDEPPPVDPDEEAMRLMQEGLDPIALPACRREALLRRILQRTGDQPPLSPAPGGEGPTDASPQTTPKTN
jgi:hypothetical protein